MVPWRRLRIIWAESLLCCGHSGDILVDAGHCRKGWTTRRSAGLSALDGWCWCMSVRHVGWYRLRCFTCNGPDWDCCQRHVHLGEWCAKAVHRSWGLCYVTQFWRHGLGSLHSVRGEGIRACSTWWWCWPRRWNCKSRKTTKSCVRRFERGEHLVWRRRRFLGRPHHVPGIHVLELEKLLDIVLGVPRLDISKTGLLQMLELRDCGRTKHI